MFEIDHVDPGNILAWTSQQVLNQQTKMAGWISGVLPTIVHSQFSTMRILTIILCAAMYIHIFGQAETFTCVKV